MPPLLKNRMFIIIFLGIVVIAAMIVTEYAYMAAPGPSEDNPLLSFSESVEGSNATSGNITGSSPTSMHTMISVVLIMSMAMVGMIILGWEKKKI